MKCCKWLKKRFIPKTSVGQFSIRLDNPFRKIWWRNMIVSEFLFGIFGGQEGSLSVKQKVLMITGFIESIILTYSMVLLIQCDWTYRKIELTSSCEQGGFCELAAILNGLRKQEINKCSCSTYSSSASTILRFGLEERVFNLKIFR